ncbi:ankyrin repeat-containing domain protein, partial [Microdochium trichocladiopsis]
GSSALHKAAEVGNEDMARLLLSYGARVDSRDIQGLTPLCVATGNNHLAIAKLLLEAGADPLAIDYQGKRCSLQTVGRHNAPAVWKLLDFGASLEATLPGQLETPLLHAIENKQDEVVQILVARGASLTARDKDGRDPLLKAISLDRRWVTHLLLDSGVAVETVDSYGTSALALAAGSVMRGISARLLELGAVLETKDRLGRTPLVWAVESEVCEDVRLLLDNGAAVDPLSTPQSGTPLNAAVRDGSLDIVQALLEAGADVQ